jgi:hypothetical protein
VSDRSAELDALIDALVREREALLDRLDELELRVSDLERPDWMTLEQAADHLHSTADALRHRAQRGKLPGAVKDESRWLVDRRALDNALAATTLRATTEQNGRAPRTRPRPRHRRY